MTLMEQPLTDGEVGSIERDFVPGGSIHRLAVEWRELRAATAELRSGDGTYYLTQERAMAPGIADGWPDVIPAPHTKNGRLVKRKFAIVDAQ